MTRAWISAIAVALALTVLAVGIRYGAMVAGGADSYGYVSQAGLWRQGRLIVQQEIVRSSPWPAAAESWSPLGYRPSPHQPDGIVPVYAPGLPLLMALGQAIAGYCGAFVVVPLCGALTVWLTFVLGRRTFGAPGVALWGASLVSTSPVFLYQLMNAMSDVPVTAFWTLALVLAVMRRPLASGLAMSIAIAIRPNLAPLAFVIIAWMWLAERSSGMLMWFAAGMAPSVVGIAWLNGVLYESPLVSGYGTTGDLYALRFFDTNVRQFAVWLADVETPLVAVAALYFAAPRLVPAPTLPAGRLLLGGTLGAVIVSYVFYQPFDVWWYLRFLLPMWPVLMLTMAATINALARRWAGRFWPVAVAPVVLLLAYHGVRIASERHVFDLGRGERRYIDVGRFVASHTEPDAVMLSVQHSGSLRLYGGRLTLRYEVVDPLWLDRVLDHLQSIGRHPYFVLDGGEVEAFRARFGGASRAGALDWRPIATLGPVVSVYDPIARTREPPLAIASTRGARLWWRCEPPQSWPPVLRMK